MTEQITNSKCSVKLPRPGATIYLIGAGGCGMSALGHLLIDLGYTVAGSDLVLNEETDRLSGRGARIFKGHSDENFKSLNPSLVVYSTAIRESNVELKTAREMGVLTVHRSKLLSNIASFYRLICVAGMHGKTTTSALTAYALDKLGANPCYAIGWHTPQLTRNGKCYPIEKNSGISQAPYFVSEADESDGSLNLFEPEHSIILNIDREHMDYFGSFERILADFDGLVQRTKGLAVLCNDIAELSVISAKYSNVIAYGLNPRFEYSVESDSIKTIEEQDNLYTHFKVFRKGSLFGDFKIRLLGRHNVLNAIGVIALLNSLGYEAESIAGAIREFKGALRRQEELYNDGRIKVFDDYGHHPTEIRATITALKQFCKRKFWVAFQPHRYTRTRDLLKDFGRCFYGADKVWVMEIYGAGEDPIANISGKSIVEEIKANGQKAEFTLSVEEICQKVFEEINEGDVVLFCGAGADITKAAHLFAERLKLSGDCKVSAG